MSSCRGQDSPGPNTPAQFKAMTERDIGKYAALVKAAGARLD